MGVGFDPANYCGWIPDPDRREWTKLQDRGEVKEFPLRIRGPLLDKPGTPIWEIAKLVNGGKHLPSLIQEIGDCVSFGCTHAGNYTAAYEIGFLGQEENWRCWYPPFIYGVSRVAPDLGNGELGRGDGSMGSWGAGALSKYGVLFADDPGVPAYSGSVAKDWGYKGPPKEHYEQAHDNLVEGISPVSGVDNIRTALVNYKTCTFAFMWDLADRPKKVSKGGKDFGVLTKASRLGGHQVCLLAWDDDLPGALVQNSWPHSMYEGFQFNDEPAGSAWIRDTEIERILRDPWVEVYSLALFQGSPSDPDWRPGIVAKE